MMHYTEFRARIYSIIDRALSLVDDPNIDSIHEDADDSIDDLLIDVEKSYVNKEKDLTNE